MLAAAIAALSFSGRSAPLDPPTHAKRHRVHLREATVWASERASNVSKGLHSSACPCDDPALCEPVSGPPLRSKEIFGCGTGSPEPTDLDWSRVTTIAWAGANTTVTRADAIPAERFERGALAALERDHLLCGRLRSLHRMSLVAEPPCPVGPPTR